MEGQRLRKEEMMKMTMKMKKVTAKAGEAAVQMLQREAGQKEETKRAKQWTTRELESAVGQWLLKEQEKANRMFELRFKEAMESGGLRRAGKLELPVMPKLLKVKMRKSVRNQAKAYLQKGIDVYKAVFELGGPNGEAVMLMGLKPCRSEI